MTCLPRTVQENVNCMPTTHCLIELVSMPFLVVDMEEVEIVSLERVGHSALKSFDMVLVFKDFTKPVQAITSIPSKKLDAIKVRFADSPSHVRRAASSPAMGANVLVTPTP